jgi:hypothetical protein
MRADAHDTTLRPVGGLVANNPCARLLLGRAYYYNKNLLACCHGGYILQPASANITLLA